jgi:predicted TIM-barrel enzyme
MSEVKQTRKAILTRLHNRLAEGCPIIGAGAGTGLSARAAEMGGVDLIVIYNSGRYRMAGRSSLAGYMPYGDANAIIMEVAAEVVGVIEHTPVLASLCGTDPFRKMSLFLPQVEAAGFSGIQNFPTVGLIDGVFRQNLEETGISYAQEVDMIRQAHARGVLTAPYCFNEQEAEQMTDAGADIVVAHMGLTTRGNVGALTAITLEEAVERVQRIADAAHGCRNNVLVICHGGPIAEPQDAQFIFEQTRGVVGFFGGSSFERLPIERAIAEQVQNFTGLRLRE